MTIKQRKMILHFLKAYETLLVKDKKQELSMLFHSFFSREELIAILEHSYFDQDLEEHHIEDLENSDLLELIGDDYFLLTYLIDKIENSITASPSLSKKEIEAFFERIGSELHYLYTKPIDKWDEYDRSNYNSLLFKHGKTNRVFAIFTSDVEDKDKYAVTTKPSFFFDTKEEAEAELKHILKEKKFKKDELKIMSLWQIT
jgi:hypothetical protein